MNPGFLFAVVISTVGTIAARACRGSESSWNPVSSNERLKGLRHVSATTIFHVHLVQQTRFDGGEFRNAEPVTGELLSDDFEWH